MNEERSRVRMTIDLAKLKESGMDPKKTQETIYHFFIDKGFTYDRHLGFVYDHKLSHEELLELEVKLRKNGWFQIFYSFDTDVIGETIDLTHLFRQTPEEYDFSNATKNPYAKELKNRLQ
jgi:hypothetical protein